MRRYIAMMVLLLMGGSMMNRAWSQVTYKILTLPFTTWERVGSGGTTLDFTGSENIQVLRQNVRVEAMTCTSTETTVGLPDAFKSPLAKNFKYWRTPAYLDGNASYRNLYGYSTTTYQLYTDPTVELTEGDPVPAGVTTIYVTYEYKEDNTILDLEDSTPYNVRTDNNFLVYNMFWGNRASGYSVSSALSEGAYHLSDPGITTMSSGNKSYNFRFVFDNESRDPDEAPNSATLQKVLTDYATTANSYQNPDPYNIRVRTDYSGNGTYFEKDKNIGSDVVKEFRGSCFFVSASKTSVWMSSDYDKQWINNTKNGVARYYFVPGYFRGSEDRKTNPHDEMRPIINSFALLNHPKGGGYALVASKTTYDQTPKYPKNSTTYLFWNTNTGLTEMKEGTLDASCNASKVNFYQVRDYTFHVKTPFGRDLTATGSWSDYAVTVADSAITVSHVPEALKRKYCNIVGFYKDADLEDEDEITKYSDLNYTEAAGRHIYIKYEVKNLPFETLPVGGSYADATWYTLRLNGNNETKHIAYYDYEGDIIKSGGGSNSNLHEGDNRPEAYFAFMGDPYELKILNRSASETASANRYVGCASGSEAETNFRIVTTTEAICRWEIVPDKVSGSMRFRQLGTYEDPKYIGWNYVAAGADNPMTYSATATYVRVVELAKKTYRYHIMRSDYSIAVMASEEQEYGVQLSYNTIPEIIRSPFLGYTGADIKFYWTKADAEAKTNEMTYGSYADASEYDIYVRYDLSGVSTDTYPQVGYINGGTFNVRLNSQYVYYDSGNATSQISTKADIGGNATTPNYLWVLGGNDPYAMTIKSSGASSGSEYIKTGTLANDIALGWDSEANASKFVLKAGTVSGVWEVMVATGDDTNASETYYHIGRPEDNTVKLYKNTTYQHGYAQIGFQLTYQEAHNVTYHLIDHTNKELLSATVRHMADDTPHIPAEYWSPLVDTYKYYVLDNFKESGDNTFTLKDSPTPTPLSKVGDATDIYITYTANTLVDMDEHTMYLLKFEMGDNFRQEDGGDGMIGADLLTDDDRSKAVYPYCNGDGCMNVYGQYQYDLQQEGAASTRTRWAWYVVSSNHDPYHVKILSRQSMDYDGMERHAYFATKKPDDYSEVITTLVWPSISGEAATDYMVLGSEGHYQLVTSYTIPIDTNQDDDYTDEGESNKRYVVNRLEQYWKTYDTVKKKLLSDLLETCDEKDQTDRSDGSIEVPTSPETLRQRLTGTGDGEFGFHGYDKMAYAKRWNGYNSSGAKSKGWETREHWFQTIRMGEGYLDFVETTIDPALILLDQHGWEIMRKPLPTGPDDEAKEEKYKALATYDSPMVKEYYFWSSAKKRSGFHQYYLMDKRIGGDFTSTSLTDLPPYGSANVLDSKGNLNDQYVTYTVRDEYVQSYVPSTTPTAYPFLIQQGDNLAKNDGTTTIATEGVSTLGASQYIINNIDKLTPTGTLKTDLWYVKPNTSIDTEMGYTSSNHDWGNYPNAYEDDAYKTLQVAQLIESDADAIKKYGRFSFSNGFDPYNIQISSNSGDVTQYFTLGLSGAAVEEGAMQGAYGSQTVALAAKNSDPVSGTGHDHAELRMTNQTLMAVSDENGNMQLMPRFDHSLRVRNFKTLVTPTAESEDANKLKETYTQLYRPYVYNYLIIDNEGLEALHYRSGGDLLPQIPSHLQSPMAQNFKFYKTAQYNANSGSYYITESTDETTSDDEITDEISLAGAGLTDGAVTKNVVYVRYDYNEDADASHVLLGKWVTMTLNGKNIIYDGGIKQYSADKPNPVDNDDSPWQWKLLRHPYGDPDPYGVRLLNRSQKDMPMWSNSLQGANALTATTGTNNFQRFVLLSHEDGDYALAVAGTKDPTNFSFLNGKEMTTSVGAVLQKEAGFNSTAGVFDGTQSQVVFTDEVVNNYIYKVYTHDYANEHDGKYGQEAIRAEQSASEASYNEFVPTLPEEIRSPLLNQSDFVYYESLDDVGTTGHQIGRLYGLYDGQVYVRYTYDSGHSNYKVPNQRNATTETQVAEGTRSNPGTLKFGDQVRYNIFWLDDERMEAGLVGDAYSITSQTDQPIENSDATVWQFIGDDPYAIRIKLRADEKYVHESTSTTCDLNATAATATPFMLLPREGYEYGVLAKTGEKTKMLSGRGNELTTDAPTKFIFFGLGTGDVIYRLVIKNIGKSMPIPYRSYISSEVAGGSYNWNNEDGNYTVAWAENDGLHVRGTSKRDLTSDKYQLGETLAYPPYASGDKVQTTYCFNNGPISLGDTLTVPDVFYRPNVQYSFIVHDIYTGDTRDVSLNTYYRGLEVKSKKMSLNNDMIGKTVYIDIIYGFNTELVETNAGNDFVTDLSQNRWYTLETVIDGTPWLAQFTNAWGFELKEGHGVHYTNDYLWSPIGDVYGFQLYNRYTDKNSGDDNTGDKHKVINSYFTKDWETDEQFYADAFKENKRLFMRDDGTAPDTHKRYAYSVYELLEAPTDGYFYFHPVVNTGEPQYYFNYQDADDDGDGVKNRLVRLSTTPMEVIFGLSMDLVEPYYTRAGYVGGLTAEGKELYEQAPDVIAKQAVVYDDNNIVQFTQGYYRMHSPPGDSGIDPVRYASGYTHKTELTGNNGKPIPMHFYELNSSQLRTFTDLNTGFTTSNATRGDLTILPVAQDPASIFYCEKPDDDSNVGYFSAEGLYIKGEKGKAYVNNAAVPAESEGTGKARAFMTESTYPAGFSELFVMDIGGAVLLLQDNTPPQYRKYLSYDQSVPDSIYDLKLTHNAHTDLAKWCLQPVQKTATAGDNEMGLTLTLHNGGDGYYYATFYAPFDVLLTDATNDQAFICKQWNQDLLHLKKVGTYNLVGQGCPADYAGSDQFIPAGTAVIIRSTNTSATLALPTTTPSTSLASYINNTVGNIFQGEYLEQLLAEETGSNNVFVFGVPYGGTFTPHADYSTASNENNGVIRASQAESTEADPGFYINVNNNREAGLVVAEWTRNNRYVFANRIYYRPSGAGVKPFNQSPSYVPVTFDDDDEPLEENIHPQPLPDRVYDLSGRCVATGIEAKNGTWQMRVAPGIYVVGGKKVRVR